MPDPTFQTVSATQLPALFNKSSYSTRWMLYHEFLNRQLHEVEETSRMKWGKIMQPAIETVAAADLRLEVEPDEQYQRRGPIGCTRDSIITDPQRGMGALEIKCIFDYSVWAQRWGGGKAVPLDYEVQLQGQMHVGDGDTPFDWGVIAAWVCGDLQYFERERDVALCEELEDEAGAFLAEVEAKREPDPFGLPMEVPLLDKLVPIIDDEVADLRDEADAFDKAETARIYGWAQTEKSRFTKLEKELKAKVRVMGGDAATVLLPDTRIYLTQSASKDSVVSLPAEMREWLLQHADEMSQTIADWETVTRKGGVSTRIKVAEVDDPRSPPPDTTEIGA